METKTPFDEISSILIHESDIHHQLITSAESMNSCLRSGNHDALGSATLVYDDLICRLEKVEERRIELCSKISTTNSLNSGAKLSTLLQFASDETRTVLEKISFDLKELVRKLSAINESNRVLLEESLNALGASLDMIKESSQQYKGYRHRGDRKDCTSGITIFNQVI